MSRRRFLGWAGLSAGGLAIAASGASPGSALAKSFFADDPFSLGVASGDPRSDGVVLWTRLAPEPLAEDGSGGLPPETYGVRYEVAEDERFSRVVRRGAVEAGPQLAHSVHVEVEGLWPGREYFYRFRAGPETSPVGRTKTAPAFGAANGMAFAFASCQNYPAGYYTAYGHMADEDLDLVVHLGDYIYQGPSQGSIGRPHAPAREATTLADYRIRTAQYKSDPDLRAAHARHPFAVTWDDHEVDNNYADENGDPAPGQTFLQRRAAAYQAYFEHQPLRPSAQPQGPDLRLYRRLTYGDLAEFSLLDTRQYRDNQANCPDPDERDCAERIDPSRTMLGQEQERWLLDGLTRSPARWNVLAQQVIFSQLDFREGPEGNYNTEAWDGYVAARQRILDVLGSGRPANPIVLTGDVHKNYVANVKQDFDDEDSPTVGAEFVGTSISSGGDGTDQLTDGQRNQLAENPHVLFIHDRRGYVRCTLDRSEWRTDLREVPYVRTPDAPITTRASFVVENGVPGTQRA